MKRTTPRQMSMKDCIFAAFHDKAVITSDGLAPDEFIYVFRHKAYYEDGCCLGSYSKTLELLNSQEWTHNYNWWIFAYLEDDDEKDIEELHKYPTYSKDYKIELGRIFDKDRNKLVNFTCNERKLLNEKEN